MQQTFTGGSIGFDINQVAIAHNISPAALATIVSMETEGLTGPDYNSDSYGCSPCNGGGAGATQISRTLFDEWNSGQQTQYTFCSDICGPPGSSQLRRNLEICSEYLLGAFYAALGRGYGDQIQLMALAASSWNGLACGYDSQTLFYPFDGSYSPHYLPGADQFTDYGSTAGFIYANSGLVGFGVFDTSQVLPT